MRGLRVLARVVLVVLAAAATGGVSSAHGRGHHITETHDPTPTVPRDWHELWRTWAFEPLVVVPLVLTAVIYARGVARLWRAAGTGRGVRGWEFACFAGGWLTLVAALVSPLHPWGAALFSAHMVQHELLMLVAAPLLVLGNPLVAALKALPPGRAVRLLRWAKREWLRRVWRVATNPFVAWLGRVD